MMSVTYNVDKHDALKVMLLSSYHRSKMKEKTIIIHDGGQTFFQVEKSI